MRFCFLNECFVRQSIGSNIQKLKTRISNTTKSFQDYGITPVSNGREDSSSSSHQQLYRRAYSHVANDDFIELDNDVEMLIGHLVNENDDDLNQIVSISGMGGLGKTTLARKVYNHPRIQGYFDNLAWVSISKDWKKSDILQGILIKFFVKKRDKIMKLRDEELMRKLSQTFGNKKCLVVLDDIWSTRAWESIKDAFPLRKNGSKILLTTRKKNVALHMAPNILHHEPRLLNDMESWELLQIKALGEEPQIVDEQMHEVKQLGKEMVKYCGGLPLAVVVLGRILARNRGIEGWKKVHKNVKAHIGRGEDNMEEQGKVKKILALSYDDLPLKFKPCFLYLGRYPEDFAIDAEKLYQLWIAEGMILAKDKIGDESKMDVAERYLGELEERSLVQVVMDDDKMRMTTFQSCRLHDLVRDMSLEMAKEENFFSLVHPRNCSDDEACKFSSLTNKIHRLVIHLEKDVLNFIPPPKRTTRHLRSLKLVVDIEDYEEPITRAIHSQIIQFEMLRSLEIMVPSHPKHKSFQNAFGLRSLRSVDSRKLSVAIGNLIHLRYLSLGGYLYFHLTLSIGNLKQLETLDLRDLQSSHISNMMWKLTQLKHLYLPKKAWAYMGEKLRFDGLNKLEILEGFDSRFCCSEDLVKLANLRRLEARTLRFKDDNLDLIFSLDSRSSIKMDLTIFGYQEEGKYGQMRSTNLSKLFSCEKILKLEISHFSIDSLPNYRIGLASHLIDLTLHHSKFQDDPMQLLGKLSNLKYLVLGEESFVGTEMNCHSGSFLQLRKLQLWYLHDLKELNIAKGAMLNLLVIRILECKELEMIPDGLRFIKTLIKLKVEWMPEEFIRRIQVIDGQEGEDYYKIRHVPTIKVNTFEDVFFWDA